MRRSLGLLSIVLVAGCGPKPYIGTGPATKHQDVSFRAVSTKLEYKNGEPVRLAGYVKNEGKRLATLLVDQEPRLGVKCSVEILGKAGKYEPIAEPPKQRPELSIDNSSFLILDPGTEARVTVFDVRNAKGPDGKEGNLPPGDYTAKVRYEVVANAGGAEGMNYLGDSKKMIGLAPRAVWEAEVSFKVSSEAFTPPSRRPRGGGPSGG